MQLALAAAAAFLIFGFHGSSEKTQERRAPLIVHEWGTFTSLQDRRGRTILGINTDDEPVPSFVHQVWGQRIITDGRLVSGIHLAQGAPECHPDVAMRMETPVLYFYPPADKDLLTVDVLVKYPGGWITEYYPDAMIEIASTEQRCRIGPDTQSTLRWHGIEVGRQIPDSGWPRTSEHVWLSPRKVASAPVQTANGESEKYLFYRGVGHAHAPIQVTRSGRVMEIRGVLPAESPTKKASIGPVWLLDVLPDGRSYWTSVLTHTVVSCGESNLLAQIRLPDPKCSAYSSRISELRASMAKGLIEQGLYPDEAAAMLDTWSLSYFRSSGLRVFYTLGQDWTDATLPLSIEAEIPVTIARVMMGRLECITDWQEKHINTILASDYPSAESLKSYEHLGRFRQAIVLDHGNRLHSDKLLRISKAQVIDLFQP
jgi:hypothetical protein